MIQRDLGRSKNNMVLSGGSYRITDEGMIEDMARRRHHHRMHRYMNPESSIAMVVMVGLVVFVGIAVTDLIRSALPAQWSNRAKSIGLDIALIATGLLVFKKSHVWGLGLAAAGVASASTMAYKASGLDAKIQNIFHHAPARTITASSQNADGSWSVTYSDNTTAQLPVGSTASHTVGSSGMLPAARMQAYMRPRAAMRAV
jgi:hypothetical protein